MNIITNNYLVATMCQTLYSEFYKFQPHTNSMMSVIILDSQTSIWRLPTCLSLVPKISRWAVIQSMDLWYRAWLSGCLSFSGVVWYRKHQRTYEEKVTTVWHWTSECCGSLEISLTGIPWMDTQTQFRVGFLLHSEGLDVSISHSSLPWQNT